MNTISMYLVGDKYQSIKVPICICEITEVKDNAVYLTKIGYVKITELNQWIKDGLLMKVN